MIKILKLSALLLVALASLAIAEKIRYDNYRLVRVYLKNEAQASLIERWDDNIDFDLWFVDREKLTYADVLLSPAAFAKYNALFEINQMKLEIVQENIQDIMDEEERQLFRSRMSRANIVNRFATYSEIQGFLDEIVDKHSELASVYSAGKSVEGRDLRVIVLKTKTSSKKIWIDCGIHAREWVSHPTCVYIIDKLVTSDKKLLDEYEFHILPLLNPDGYEYTKTSRLWRKNRRVNSGSTCLGVDLNRNYNYQWMANGGASSSPCSETFAGPTAESEPETKAVRDAIGAYSGQWKAFFTVHSYGQWWLLCYGHDKVQVSDYAEMLRVANVGTSAIAAAGDSTKFVAGQSSVLLYINSGTSQDWAKGTAGIKYSYTLELRPGQSSPDASYGFLLPEDRLPGLTKETFEGIKAAIAAIP